MNRRLKPFPGKANFHLLWGLLSLLLAPAVSVLFLSCESRGPEADELGIETSQVQEDRPPADSTGVEEAPNAAPPPASSDAVGGEAGEEGTDGSSSEAEDFPSTTSSPTGDGAGDFAAADPVSEAAADSEIDSSEVVDEGGRSLVPASPAAVPERKSDTLENNPLLFADRPPADSAGVEEAPDAAPPPASAKVTTPAGELASGQSSQPNEADPAASAAAPMRFLEAPGNITITLDSIGWIFRSDRSTPGAWRFLGREIIGDSTNFHFLFSEIGRWNLVFERQDLSSGKSEEVIRKVAVDEADGLLGMENGPIPTASQNPISGEPPADADARYAAARAAATAGKIDEAIKYYEQDASRNDSAGARARGALVETAAKSGALGPLLTWLPRYLKDGPSPEVLRAALEIFTTEAGYNAQSRAILEELAESENNNPEWLYRLAILLEKAGEERDLDRAARLHQEVLSRWPLSEWRDRSEERLLWLQWHYFRVR